MKKVFFEKNFLWAVSTGVLFSTSYPPFPAWALFFCFVPLWVAWYKAPSLKSVIQAGFVAQFLFTFIGFNWIAHTSVEYGHIPLILSILILIGFSCFASLNVVFTGVTVWKIHQKWRLSPGWFFILVAVVNGAYEWFYPMIFPWNLGYPLLFSKFHSSQLAEFVGFNLVGVGVGLANAAFCTSVVRYPEKKWSRPLMVFIVVLFLAESLGGIVQDKLGTEDKKISVLIVQPNIGNYDKLMAEKGNAYQEPIVNKDLGLTSQGLAGPKKPQIIVLPETAYPANLDPAFKNDFYFMRLQSFVRNSGVPMITGAYSEDPPGSPQRQVYNAVFALADGGVPQPGYRKNILLAFGEYFPGSQYFPFLKTIIPEISDFGRGPGPGLFRISGVAYSPLICYEGLDTVYVSKALSLGGDILVNVTNDSWFGNNFEPYQHMIMTMARTVEFRRPMIRATNTGISGVADSRGKILVSGPQNVEWTGVVDVPYFSHPKTTLFSALAPCLSYIFLGLTSLTLIVGITVGGIRRT